MTDSLESAYREIFKYDELGLFFREKYKINDYIEISQPSIQDIIQYDEKEYYQMVNTLCSTPSDMKLILWKMGKDWNAIDDFTLFSMLVKGYTPEQTGILLGNLNLSEYEFLFNERTNNMTLYNPNDDTVIDEILYNHMIGYIRKMHGLSSSHMKVKGKHAIEAVIQKEKYALEERKKNMGSSLLRNLISSMLVYPGFKYKSSELKQCGIYEFMDSVQRSQIYTSTLSLLIGSSSGMVDTSKIDKDNFNWLRDVKL